MEQNADAGVPVMPMVDDKKKGGNGLKIATVVACVVAVCGIGFGVYGMMQSAQKDGQISDLKQQIDEIRNNLDEPLNKNDESGIIYAQYYIGDEVTFNGEKWHVIADSPASSDYVVVLKDQALKDLQGEPFYRCPEEDDNGINCNMKMSNDYQDSVAKQYFDNTYIDILGKNNLKEVDGYRIRLITIDELELLGCNLAEQSCDDAPSWLTDGNLFWTMSHTSTAPTNDASEADVYSFGLAFEKKVIQISGVGSTLYVRPVVNLLKSSI